MLIDNSIIFKLNIPAKGEELQDLILAHISLSEVGALEQTEEGFNIYHESKEIIDDLIETLASLKLIERSDSLVEEIANKNWNEEWESSFTPIHVGDFCTVRATFHDIRSVGIDIIINPELAFGTGHHETTYMMIDQMSRLDFQDRSVFDYGCGTAILAILAEKLGATEILAIDNDEQSVHCAKDCIDLNSSTHIDLRHATIDNIAVNNQFDIILANINRNVLLDSADTLYALTKSKGYTLLSGLMRQDEDMILRRFRSAGFSLKNICYRAEWISILFCKP